MKFISEETIIDSTKKYIEVQYNKLDDQCKNMLDEYVQGSTCFSNYLELTEYVLDSSEIHYPDLYNCDERFLHSKYLNKVVVNSKTYMMFACLVTFGDIFPYMPNFYFFNDIPCFAFYEFVDQTNTNGTVGSNMEADKMYSCEIDKDDYPKWVNIMGKRDLSKLVPKTAKILYKGNIEK